MLHLPSGYVPHLERTVAQFIKDGVRCVVVVGKDCHRVEDIIDDLAVGAATRRFILTSLHPGETLEQAIKVAHSLTGDYAGDAQIVELG